MKQERLPLPGQMQAVDVFQVQRLPSMTKAITLCVELAGFENDKDFCRALRIDSTVWSRIKDGERHFPQDLYESLFDACGNEAPLIWLADRRGYVLVPKESETQRRLRLQQEENERLQRENKLLRDLVQGRAV